MAQSKSLPLPGGFYDLRRKRLSTISIRPRFLFFVEKLGIVTSLARGGETRSIALRAARPSPTISLRLAHPYARLNNC